MFELIAKTALSTGRYGSFLYYPPRFSCSLLGAWVLWRLWRNGKLKILTNVQVKDNVENVRTPSSVIGVALQLLCICNFKTCSEL